MCKSCSEVKPFTEFYKNNATPDKLTRYCKVCCKRKERETHRKNPNKKWEHRHKELITSTGERLTKPMFTRLIEDQHNQCGICNQVMKKPCIDHNHITGSIRMLLCTNCNTMIGLAKEDTNILSRAIDYINRFNNA